MAHFCDMFVDVNIDNFVSDTEAIRELARRIRYLRLNDPTRRMSQSDLAQRAGISRSTVARFEQKGELSLPALIGILRALELFSNLDQLVPEQLPISPMAVSRAESKHKPRQRVRKR